MQSVNCQRPIRSFVRREGRMTIAQRQALTELWPYYGLELSSEKLHFNQLFTRVAPLALEIGFGMGESLLNMAQSHPEHNFIGIEVHRPGVGALLAAIEANQLKNIRLFSVDASEVMNQLDDSSLDQIYIFFPDPWPKQRHHKRRLIQPEFVDLLSRKLKIHGHLYLATDWENYAQHMLQVLNQNSSLKNLTEDNQFSPRLAQRILTRFEQRAQRLGHVVRDLAYVKL